MRTWSNLKEEERPLGRLQRLWLEKTDLIKCTEPQNRGLTEVRIEA